MSTDPRSSSGEPEPSSPGQAARPIDDATASTDDDATRPPDGDDGPEPVAGDDLAFGPSGYLPPRASARARKIVLRAPLGLQWVVGAVLAGLVVVVAGVLLLTRSGPPGEPYVRAVSIEQVQGATALPEVDALLVTAGGPAVAFAGLADHDLAFCAETRRVEGTVDGRPATWHPATGRGFGVDSLARHPVVVHDGVTYVDPTETRPGPRPAPDREPPGCR